MIVSCSTLHYLLQIGHIINTHTRTSNDTSNVFRVRFCLSQSTHVTHSKYAFVFFEFGNKKIQSTLILHSKYPSSSFKVHFCVLLTTSTYDSKSASEFGIVHVLCIQTMLPCTSAYTHHGLMVHPRRLHTRIWSH